MGDLGNFDGVITDRTDLAERFECSHISKTVLQHHGLDAIVATFSSGNSGPFRTLDV